MPIGYVKPKYDGEGNKWTTSAAQVTKVEGKIKITYLEKEDWVKKDGSMAQPTFPDGNITKVFEVSELPVKIEGVFDYVLIVQSADEDGKVVIKQLLPYNGGPYKCEFVGFSRPNGKDTPPIWEDETKKYPNKKTGILEDVHQLKFKAYYKIATNAFFKGSVLTLFLQYKFANNGNGLAALTFETIGNRGTRVKTPNNSTGQKLLDAFNASKVFEKEIAWPEDGNILPEVEARMLQANIPVSITVKNGWPSDISPYQEMNNPMMGDVPAAEQPKPEEAKLPDLNLDEM